MVAHSVLRSEVEMVELMHEELGSRWQPRVVVNDSMSGRRPVVTGVPGGPYWDQNWSISSSVTAATTVSLTQSSTASF